MGEILPVMTTTAIRALLIGLLATPIALLLSEYLKSSSRSAFRKVGLALVLIPFLSPALVVGFFWSLYSYRITNLFRPYIDSGATMKLIDQWANESVYGLLLIFHIVPVAAVFAYLLPRTGHTASADHCVELLGRRLSFFQRFRLKWVPRLPHQLIVFCTLWVMVFIDIDLAALMNVKTWSLWLFDQQVGGLALTLSMQYALTAIVPVLAVILIAVAVYKPSSFMPCHSNTLKKSIAKHKLMCVYTYLVIAIVITTLIPFYLLFAQAIAGGFTVLLEHSSFFSELGNSSINALLACAAAFSVAIWLHRIHQPVLTFIMLIPGLSGGLILALSLKSTLIHFQLQNLLSTSIPLVFALSILLLPAAVVFNWIYLNHRPSTSLHLARIQNQSPHAGIRKQASHLVYSIQLPGRILSVIVLFWLGFMELSCSALLHPAGSMPVIARLHNLMHYGHSQVLSAMIIVTLGLPLLLIAFLMLIHYLVMKVINHRLTQSFDNTLDVTSYSVS